MRTVTSGVGAAAVCAKLAPAVRRLRAKPVATPLRIEQSLNLGISTSKLNDLF
jgi:hypothetical protein